MSTGSSKDPTSVYDFSVKDAKGDVVDLSTYEGKVLLIINVASKCGLTNSNYTELNELYAKYKDEGFRNELNKGEMEIHIEQQEGTCVEWSLCPVGRDGCKLHQLSSDKGYTEHATIEKFGQLLSRRLLQGKLKSKSLIPNRTIVEEEIVARNKGIFWPLIKRHCRDRHESTWALSSMIGRMKVVFRFLRDKVLKKVNYWARKHLSYAEGEILVKFQSWKLSSCHDAITSGVLKANYYPKGVLLERRFEMENWKWPRAKYLEILRHMMTWQSSGHVEEILKIPLCLEVQTDKVRIFLWHAARDSNLKEFYAQVHAAFAKTTLRIHGTALWAAPMYRTSGYKHARGIAFGGYTMCYYEEGLEILAFPCNQFGEQEPESNDKIVDFVCTRFKSEFPIFDKIEVNGSDSAPLYKFLKSGKWGIFGDDIQWNFAKFVVDKKGQVVGRYYPTTSPLSLERRPSTPGYFVKATVKREYGECVVFLSFLTALSRGNVMQYA
ncbi:hypothetical protein V8G54_017255 [Vigna mungo]|uniref:Glutathione peroxidase n=1 Tax=Vigna mungo TaxID=3915 RepID=A0AAQ3NMW1_VIGMU